MPYFFSSLLYVDMYMNEIYLTFGVNLEGAAVTTLPEESDAAKVEKLLILVYEDYYNKR